METHILFIQYGINMLPVVVNSLRNRSIGLHTLGKFLGQAWRDLDRARDAASKRRSSARKIRAGRRDRLSIGRYHDLAGRSLKAMRLALEALERYQQEHEPHWLDVALRQFETGERFRASQVKMRLKLQPDLCNRMARAC